MAEAPRRLLLVALEHLDGRPLSPAVYPALLRSLERALETRQSSEGLGEDVRLRGESVVGSGLELEGEVIRLSAFTSRGGGHRAFGRIAQPSRWS